MNKVRQGAQSFTMGPKNLRCCNIYTQWPLQVWIIALYKDPLCHGPGPSSTSLFYVHTAKLEVQVSNLEIKHLWINTKLAHEMCFYSLLYSVLNALSSKLFWPHFESSYSSVKISIIVAGFAPVSKGFHNLLANLNYVLLQKYLPNFLNPWCFMLLIPCYFIKMHVLVHLSNGCNNTQRSRKKYSDYFVFLEHFIGNRLST